MCHPLLEITTSVLLEVMTAQVILYCIIGRAKRAPHWGVQSRFRYVGMYVCRVLKCVGGITYAHAQSLFWAVKTDL